MAIDPLTAKLLAQAAARAATDEESRRRTLILILSPILSLLLLIAFILYLITSPFSVLSQWLIGDEVGVVEDFQKEYGYNQQLGIYENSRSVKTRRRLLHGRLQTCQYGHRKRYRVTRCVPYRKRIS